MRRIISIAIFAIVLLGCNNNDSKNITADMVKNPVSGEGIDKSIKMPEITFIGGQSENATYYDFGVVIEGEVVLHTFEFKNTGDADLIIRSTSTTCGCTVPSYSSKPIKPGETGSIEVSFNSSGRSGRQHKSVTVVTNAQPASVKLVFEANVVIPK